MKNFRQEVETQRAVPIIIALAWIPAVFVALWISRRLFGLDSSPILSTGVPLLLMAGVWYLFYRLSERKCPNCKRPFGMFHQSWFPTKAKCPQCGFEAK